jgi:hypothetical protein
MGEDLGEIRIEARSLLILEDLPLIRRAVDFRIGTFSTSEC